MLNSLSSEALVKLSYQVLGSVVDTLAGDYQTLILHAGYNEKAGDRLAERMQLIAIMVNLTRLLPDPYLPLAAVTLATAACLGFGFGQSAFAESKESSQTIATAPATDTPAQGAVQVIFMYDSHCTVSCQQVLPIVRELKKKYGDRVNFTELNTSPDAIKEAKKRAKELGVLSFMADYADYIPIVGVFNAKRKLCKDLVGPKTRDIYEAAIQKVLTEYKPADSK